MNSQPITKQDLTATLYPISEIFYSIQGEGPWQGKPAIFIRLAGCNLRCTWCDTDYTVIRDNLNPFEIINQLTKLSDIKTVIITGGEPFIHNLTPLVNLLYFDGYKIQIETNGTLNNPDFPWYKALIVCSPKAGIINRDIQMHCREYKYVVSARDKKSMTGFPTEATQPNGKTPPTAMLHPAATIWVMPQDDHTGNSLKVATDICLKFGFRLALRLHKILGVR